MIEATAGAQHELQRPGDFWEIVLGSGYRMTVDALDEEQRQRLREHVVGALSSRGTTRVRNDVVFGAAVKR